MIPQRISPHLISSEAPSRPIGFLPRCFRAPPQIRTAITGLQDQAVANYGQRGNRSITRSFRLPVKSVHKTVRVGALEPNERIELPKPLYESGAIPLGESGE